MRLTSVASLLLVSLIGCGSTTVNTTDPDAAVENPDAAIVVQNTTMEVRSLGSEAPLPGIHVLYFDVDDTLLSDEVTDASGRVSAPLPAGGSVVLMYIEEGQGELAILYRDNPPGATLKFGGYSGGAAMSSTIVTYPARPGSTSYSTRVACKSNYSDSSGASPVTINMYSCVPGEAAEVYVDAFTDGVLAGTATLLNSTLTAGMAVTGTYLNPRPLQVTVSDISASFTNGGVTLYSQRPSVYQLYEQGSSSLPVVGGQIVANLNVRDIPGRKILSIANLYSLNKEQHVYTLGEVASSVAISAAELAPFAQSPTLDIATNSVVWAEVGGGSADLSYGSVSFDRGGTTTYWYLVGAHDGPRLKLPTLPAEYSAYNVLQTDVVNIPVVQLIRAGAASEAVRQDPIGVMFFQRIPLESGQRMVQSRSYE